MYMIYYDCFSFPVQMFAIVTNNNGPILYVILTCINLMSNNLHVIIK